MTVLLKKEPKSSNRGKLYSKIDPSEVNCDTEVFTIDWLKKACKYRSKVEILSHLQAGHFGPYCEVADENYEILEGHRAVCRVNNSKYSDQAVSVYSREQWDDIKAGRTIRESAVLVRGRVMTKAVSLKNYSPKDFIAVKRYSVDQANILAADRVVREVGEKRVDWHALSKKSEEYKEKFTKRWRLYNNLYSKEIALVARDMASEEEMSQATDLPASIFSLIDNKLTVTQALTYISRWLDFLEMYDNEQINNPALSFRIHQVILEEILIEHYRDVQMLNADSIDKPMQDALKGAIMRHQALMPGDLMKPISASSLKDDSSDSPVRSAPTKTAVAEQPYTLS
jgi:hypothetical protein